MRVAALYDIHGNLPALEAVLQEVRQAKVDQIVVGGDVVTGPMPRETLACLLALDIPVRFIAGNCEGDILTHMAGGDISGITEPYRTIVGWVADQLYPDYQPLLASWQLTTRLDMDGLGSVLFCHATPRNDNEIFTRLTAVDRLMPVFEGLDVSVVVVGHTHMQFDRTVGKIRVVNAGSVGSLFGEPGADWLLLGPTIEFQHTRYDLEKAADRIRQSNYPQAEEFARDILQPRSPDEMVKLYTAAGLK